MGLLVRLKSPINEGGTALKSLKYGNDRPDGGDSGQPYIKSPIDQPSSISDEDTILRGGLKAPSSALEDVSRLTKYFFDFKNPDGLLFVAKQNILSRISPKTETSFGLDYGGLFQNINLTTNVNSNEGIYTPLSTIAQAGVGFTGIHLNQQETDPTGLSSALSIKKYQDVAIENNKVDSKVYTNRLLKLWDNTGLNLNNAFSSISPVLYSYEGGPDSILGVGKTNIKFATANDGIIPSRTNNLSLETPTRPEVYYRTLKIFGDSSVSIKYSSSIGISDEKLFGSNNYLKTYENQITLGLPKNEYLGIYNRSSSISSSQVPLVAYDLKNIFNKGASIVWTSKNPSTIQNIFGKSTLDDYFNSFNNTSLDRLGLPSNTTSSNASSLSTETSPYATWGSNEFASQTLNLDHTTLEDFRNRIEKTDKTYTFLSQGYYYDIDSTFNSTSPGKKGNISNYIKGKGIDGLTGPLDKITSSPIYKSNTSIEPLGRSKEDEYQDLCPFIIAILNNELQKGGVYKKFMHFRAFIDNFSDGYNAEWKSIEYLGRAEKFYKYSGFSRDISIGFTVVAQSKKELTPMYDKLNFLASSLAPEYLDSSTTGYMAGNISYITVGDYLVDQPGIITSLDFEIPEESPWETARDQIGDLMDPKDVRRLPFMIKVKMKFTPIHKFRPSKQTFKNAPKGAANSTTLLEPGNQRYIDQSRPLITNYDEEAGGNQSQPFTDEEFDTGEAANPGTITEPSIPAKSLEESNVLLDTSTNITPNNSNLSSLISSRGIIPFANPNNFTSNNLF